MFDAFENIIDNGAFVVVSTNKGLVPAVVTHCVEVEGKGKGYVILKRMDCRTINCVTKFTLRKDSAAQLNIVRIDPNTIRNFTFQGWWRAHREPNLITEVQRLLKEMHILSKELREQAS